MDVERADKEGWLYDVKTSLDSYDLPVILLCKIYSYLVKIKVTFLLFWITEMPEIIQGKAFQ